MSNIIPFDFDGAPVRAVSIDGEPHLVGKDVAERLGYANATQAITTHCKGVQKRYPLQTPGGMQDVRVLSGPDVLRLIIGSKLPAAERFERWVFEEVLPAIRKTGGYIVASPEETPEELFLRAMNVLKATVDRQRAQLAIAAPKAEALDIIAEADGDRSFQETAKALQIRPCELLSWLETNRWIYRRNTTGIWLGHAAPTNAGYLRFTTTPRGNGLVSEQTKVTKRGLAKLATIFGQKNLGLNGDVS